MSLFNIQIELVNGRGGTSQKTFSFTPMQGGDHGPEVQAVKLLLKSDAGLAAVFGELGRELSPIDNPLFDPLTVTAVMKFQELYEEEIRSSWALISQTSAADYDFSESHGMLDEATLAFMNGIRASDANNPSMSGYYYPENSFLREACKAISEVALALEEESGSVGVTEISSLQEAAAELARPEPGINPAPVVLSPDKMKMTVRTGYIFGENAPPQLKVPLEGDNLALANEFFNGEYLTMESMVLQRVFAFYRKRTVFNLRNDRQGANTLQVDLLDSKGDMVEAFPFCNNIVQV